MGTAPGLSRGLNKHSCAELDDSLNFAYRALEKAHTVEPTFGPPGVMDEFRRLKVRYLVVTSQERFQSVSGKVVREACQ